MEQKNEKNMNCVCGCFNHHHHSPLWKLVKVFVVALVILLAILLGVLIGRRGVLLQRGWGYQSMTASGKQMAGAMGAGGTMPNMMYINANTSAVAPGQLMPMTQMQRGKMDPGAQRVAGVITAISGTAITLTDNGGKQQTVYSSSDTNIYSGSSEIALSALKAKEFVVCYVVMKNGQNTAETITVSQ